MKQREICVGPDNQIINEKWKDNAGVSLFKEVDPILDSLTAKVMTRAHLVVRAAHNAHLAIPERKLISMATADLRELRDLGKEIDGLDRALSEYRERISEDRMRKST